MLVPALHALRDEQKGEPLEVRLQYEAADVLLDRLEEGEYEAAFVYKRKVSNVLTYKEYDYVFGRWFDANFGAQPSRLTSRSHFTELEDVIDFVARGVGLSVVPRDSAEESCDRGDVEILYAGSGAPCFNQVFTVSRAASDVRPQLRRLVDLLRGSEGR